MSEEIRIYVADLAAYNNGKLHGVWLDATDDLDKIWNTVTAMLKASPEPDAEEWAIHDYEGFGNYRLSEWESFERIQEIAQFIEDHPAIGTELLSHFGGELEEARIAAEENYYGCYTSLADYAQQLAEDTTEIPENLAYYLDYERMGRDIELSGDIFTIETAHDKLHVFWSH